MRGASRAGAALVAVCLALLLQVTVFPHFAWHGVVPDLVLLVVVAAALATDTRFATLLGFGAGLLLDLAPPADHVAGRWALALMLVGYVVGRLAHHSSGPGPLAQEPRRVTLPVALAAGAGGSFVGTSAFLLSGMVLRDPAAGVPDLLTVVGTALVLDVLAAALVVPLTTWVLTRPTGTRASRVTPRAPRRSVV